MAKELVSLEAVVEAIIYTNEKNGFTVCEVETSDASVCAVGYMPYISEGETLRLSGTWGIHPDYGEQFKVEYYEKVEPSDSVSIIRYLSSGIISGVGAVMAQRIVDKFGEDSLRVLRDEPEQLALIKGISPKKAQAINESFVEQSGVQSIVMFLNRFGVTPNFALKVYKQFGSEAVDVIQENPYRLCEDIYGIGFKKADKIGLSLGVLQDDPSRVAAGVRYILQYNSQNGHTYLPREKLVGLVCRLLGVDEDSVQNVIVSMLIDSVLHAEQTPNGEHIYLYEMYQCELRSAQKLMLLSSMEIKEAGALDYAIEKAEESMGITLEQMQHEAVEKAVRSGLMVITGGPGTGKTTIIRTVLSVFERIGLRVALCAPTGRAAKRMTALCGHEAKTIHRMLEMSYGEDRQQQFGKNERNPLDFDAVIVDEVSMVDIVLLDSLLAAMPSTTRLIMVGDADQLPSVGAGNVLSDMIECGCVRTVRLTEIFRQAKESMIVVNAHKIINGEYPISNTGDFFFIHTDGPDQIVPTIVDLCRRRLPETYQVEDLFGIQVISPSKKGVAGIHALNQALQDALNPPQPGRPERASRDFSFRIGDKVMQVRNNYDMPWTMKYSDENGTGVFNGDEGIITNIDPENSCLYVLFDEERIVKYDFLQLDELEPAYAITVHKSQGSEFEIVVMPMYQAPPMLLSRNLFYTAVTRAKRLVVLVGSERIMRTMVDNNRHVQRYSSLDQKLSELNEDG